MLPTAEDPSEPVGRTIPMPSPPPPAQVSRHLSKLFDSLCKLKFRLDENQKPLKIGLGMYSKEDEYMDFDQECDLSGQVGAGAGPGGCGRGHHPQGDRAGYVRATCPPSGCPSPLVYRVSAGRTDC